MPKEYARLELLQEVNLAEGGTSKEIVIFRPTAKDLAQLYEAPTVKQRVEKFISTNVRAINGGTEPLEFKAADLSSPDVLEVMDVIGSFSREADGAPLSDEIVGDGITTPVVYNLQHPIKLGPQEDADVIHQIQFEAKRLSELSEFLDSAGEAAEFKVFMRLFGQLLGTKLPMTDAIINAIDYMDYYTIRKRIMGKLVTSQNRWRRILQ
jgi:hypothetical protein